MKSVLKNVFACSVFMLASVAAHATAQDEALAQVELNANGPIKHDAAPNLLNFDLRTVAYRDLSAAMASSDDDQADSSDADTMLA